MATVLSTPAEAASVPEPIPAHLRRLYRAHVTPQRATDPERTFFVEAATHEAAARKIAGTITALEYTKLFEAEQAVESPVFLVRDPAPLTRAWARVAGGAR